MCVCKHLSRSWSGHLTLGGHRENPLHRSSSRKWNSIYSRKDRDLRKFSLSGLSFSVFCFLVCLVFFPKNLGFGVWWIKHQISWVFLLVFDGELTFKACMLSFWPGGYEKLCCLLYFLIFLKCLLTCCQQEYGHESHCSDKGSLWMVSKQAVHLSTLAM